MRVGIIGCGKRFTQVYYPILKSLNWDIFLWNRSKDKSINFCEKNSCNIIEKFEDIKDMDLNLILCFVNSDSTFDVLKNLSTKCLVLIETPVSDPRLLQLNLNLGVLEQWPKLPLEQFKELLYLNNVLSRPYLVFNDGRSFDYHAISQLRSYMNLDTPEYAKGTNRSFLNSGIVDVSENLNTKPFDWTVGQIEMKNGGILQYSFTYACKSIPSIPIQFLRAYSVDGSIVTGRMKEIGNDYEIIDIRCLDKESRKIKILDVEVIKDLNTIVSLEIKSENIKWINPYANLKFDDQQTAIASMLDSAACDKFYTCRDSYIDFMCISAIKSSGYNQNTVKFHQ